MSVSQALDNALERLGLLPNAMNWRGGWDATTQYYQNDVVSSPANLSSYILDGQTALLGGADPSLNPDWIELSSATTGVQNINAGFGIALDPLGTATNPIIDNTGILSITAGAGIGVVGGAGAPPLNATISNTGVIQCFNGLGINLTGTAQNPIINNNGVRTLTAGAGMTVNNADPNNPVVINAGVTSIVSGGGLTVTAPTGPAVTITNDGVLGITNGTGISITGTAQNPVISSTVSAPVVSKFYFSNIGIGTLPQTLPANGSYNFIFGNYGFFATSFATGVPDPNGCWVVDLNGIVFQNLTGNPLSASASFTFQVEDQSGAIYVFDPVNQGGEVLVGFPTTGVVTIPRLIFPVGAMRAAGITNPNYFTILNGTDQDYKINAICTGHFPVYYPNGVQ